MDQEQDKEWKKITEMLFPPYRHPHPEAFISRVMAKIEEKEAPQGYFRFFPWSWRLSTIGLGAVAALLLIIMQPNSGLVSTESLLWEEESSSITQTDELLNLNLEDQ